MTQEEFLELCAHGIHDQVMEAIASGIDPAKPAIIKGTPVSAMFVAASSENYGAVKALMRFNVEYAEGMIAALLRGNSYVAHIIVDMGGDIDIRDSHGMTALITATIMNRADLVQDMIDLGADVNLKSKEGYTALTYTAIMFASKDYSDVDPEIVRLLMEQEADYYVAMMIAINTGNAEFIELLSDCGADLDIRDKDGRTFVMYSVMTDGKLLKMLLEYGADPDIPDNKGRTPLMIAVIDEELEDGIIDTLLEFGADIDAVDNKGLTALMWAVAGVGKAPDFMMPALIRTGGIRAEGWEKLFAFIALYKTARREMQVDIVRHLVKEGADVNIIDKRGMTALMYALMNGDDESADILSGAGAKINFEMI